MRSAVIGAWHAQDDAKRCAFVQASTRLTHTDSRAEVAAQAVALAAARIVQCGGAPDAETLLGELRVLSLDEEWTLLCRRMKEAWEKQCTVSEFAEALGLQRGVQGYAYHTAPMALYAWLRHMTDFRVAVMSVLDCGGDTDTVSAITGALTALSGGVEKIPAEWLSRITDWPLSISALRRVASGSSSMGVGSLQTLPLALGRNALFLILVLVHGFRRLAPR